MLREFTDSEGHEWRVWDVNPLLQDRLVPSGKKRRFVRIPQPWLCFESGADRRRLTPIPADWQTCDVARLQDLCDQAESVPATRY
jgi:hypothetical protein